MFRQVAVRIFLLISAIFVFSTFVLGQTSEDHQSSEGQSGFAVSAPTGDFISQASPVFADDENKALAQEATQLLDKVVDKTRTLNPSDPKLERSAELFQLRILRQEVIRVTPLLRNYADDLWQGKRLLERNWNAIDVNSAERIQSDIDRSNDGLYQANTELRMLESRKATAAIGAESLEIDKNIQNLRDEIKGRQALLANLGEKKLAATERDKRADEKLNIIKEEISKFSSAIKDADNTTKSLDTILGKLDDLTGAVLTVETLHSSYTNTSTIIFGLLVGGVILGFFGIAYISEKVRDAIFSGESGIQFVTLFSLVIAIILFGVLKILEGKELSALLGGLSGYILGRGSFLTSPPRQGATSAATPPAPAQPGGQQPVLPI